MARRRRPDPRPPAGGTVNGSMLWGDCGAQDRGPRKEARRSVYRIPRQPPPAVARRARRRGGMLVPRDGRRRPGWDSGGTARGTLDTTGRHVGGDARRARLVALAADRIFTNPKAEPHLRALFPKAVAFSPLEGTPLHFKAYAADPKTTPERAAARLRVLDHRPGAERARLSRPDPHPGRHGPHRHPVRRVVDYDSEPYGYFSVQPPEFVAQFAARASARRFKRRRGRRRGVARHDHDLQRHARHPRQLAGDGQGVPEPGRREAVIQPADDPWGFEEEPVETWSDLLGAQAIDLVPLAAFLLFAYVSFRRKSVPLKYATLRSSVAYMGFYKSNLISITDIFRVVDWSFPLVAHNLAWYLFAGVHPGVDGAVGPVLLRAGVRLRRADAADGRGAAAALARRGAAGDRSRAPGGSSSASWPACSPTTLVTHNTMVYRYVEPFWMFGRSETAALWVGLGVLLVATVFVRNLYCRFLCPLGADARPGVAAPSSASSAGPSAAPAGSARRPASGARSRARRSWSPSACAATTASGSTPTRRSARTGGSWTTEARKGGLIPLTPVRG